MHFFKCVLHIFACCDASNLLLAGTIVSVGGQTLARPVFLETGSRPVLGASLPNGSRPSAAVA